MQTSYAAVDFILFTRPKPVGHGYMFSMAVGTIGEWLKLVPFFVRGRTVDKRATVLQLVCFKFVCMCIQ